MTDEVPTRTRKHTYTRTHTHPERQATETVISQSMIVRLHYKVQKEYAHVARYSNDQIREPSIGHFDDDCDHLVDAPDAAVGGRAPEQI